MGEDRDTSPASAGTIAYVTHSNCGEIFPRPAPDRGVPRPWAESPAGVDRLSVSFDVASFDPYRFTSEGVIRHEDGGASLLRRYSRPVALEGRWKGVAFMVGVQEGPNGFKGKIECNPSRFYDPAGCTLASIEATCGEVLPALSELVERQGVESAVGLEDWSVKRVDLARDFRGVSSPALMIEGLRPLRRKYARAASLHFDPNMRGAQTLSVGTQARMVRLYDQHAAYADKGAPPGAVRWEAQLRAAHLERAGVSTLADLTPRALSNLAGDSWEWSKMGTEVVRHEDCASAIDRMVRGGALTPAKAQRLLGQLVAEASGLTWASDRKTVREYESFKASLGVVPSALPTLARMGVTVPETADARCRLDWQSGLEVAVLGAA